MSDALHASVEFLIAHKAAAEAAADAASALERSAKAYARLAIATNALIALGAAAVLPATPEPETRVVN